MRKKGRARARAVVQRKERTEDMDTFILNIGVGNGEEGGRRREEGRKEAADSPGGILHISSPPAWLF